MFFAYILKKQACLLMKLHENRKFALELLHGRNNNLKAPPPNISKHELPLPPSFVLATPRPAVYFLMYIVTCVSGRSNYVPSGMSVTSHTC